MPSKASWTLLGLAVVVAIAGTNGLTRNLDMIGSLKSLQDPPPDVCRHEDGDMQRVWSGLALRESRWRRADAPSLRALYAGGRSDQGGERTRIDLARFYSGLASGCGQRADAARKAGWGRRAQSLAVQGRPDLPTLQRLGDYYFDERRWDSAWEIYRGLTELEPKDPRAALRMGLCLFHRGDFDQAAQVFRENPALIEAEPVRRSIYLGAALQRQGSIEQALASLEKARSEAGKADSRDFLDMAFYYEGLAWESMGRSDRAQQAFRAALEENPRHPGSLLKLAASSWERRDADAALEYLSRLPESFRQGGFARRLKRDLDRFAREAEKRPDE